VSGEAMARVNGHGRNIIKATINQWQQIHASKTELQRSGSSSAAAVACEASNGGREVIFL